MTTLEAKAKFLTHAHHTIEQVTDRHSYSLAVLSVTGAREYVDLPPPAVDELLHHLERKRVEVLRASGALTP